MRLFTIPVLFFWFLSCSTTTSVIQKEELQSEEVKTEELEKTRPGVGQTVRTDSLPVVLKKCGKNQLDLLTLIHTNDLRGTAWGSRIGIRRKVGGVVARAGAIAHIRNSLRRIPCGATLLVDSGGIFRGMAESHVFDYAPDVGALNAMKYDYVSVGAGFYDDPVEPRFRLKTHNLKKITHMSRVWLKRIPKLVSNAIPGSEYGVDNKPWEQLVIQEFRNRRKKVISRVAVMGLVPEMIDFRQQRRAAMDVRNARDTVLEIIKEIMGNVPEDGVPVSLVVILSSLPWRESNLGVTSIKNLVSEINRCFQEQKCFGEERAIYSRLPKVVILNGDGRREVVTGIVDQYQNKASVRGKSMEYIMLPKLDGMVEAVEQNASGGRTLDLVHFQKKEKSLSFIGSQKVMLVQGKRTRLRLPGKFARYSSRFNIPRDGRKKSYRGLDRIARRHKMGRITDVRRFRDQYSRKASFRNLNRILMKKSGVRMSPYYWNQNRVKNPENVMRTSDNNLARYVTSCLNSQTAGYLRGGVTLEDDSFKQFNDLHENYVFVMNGRSFGKLPNTRKPIRNRDIINLFPDNPKPAYIKLSGAYFRRFVQKIIERQKDYDDFIHFSTEFPVDVCNTDVCYVLTLAPLIESLRHRVMAYQVNSTSEVSLFPMLKNFTRFYTLPAGYTEESVNIRFPQFEMMESGVLSFFKSTDKAEPVDVQSMVKRCIKSDAYRKR